LTNQVYEKITGYIPYQMYSAVIRSVKGLVFFEKTLNSIDCDVIRLESHQFEVSDFVAALKVVLNMFN